MKHNVQEQVEDFLTHCYGEDWWSYASKEGRREVDPKYWPTTVPPNSIIERAATIDACMTIISQEKNVNARYMVAQWLAAELGGPIELMCHTAMYGYREIP